MNSKKIAARMGGADLAAGIAAASASAKARIEKMNEADIAGVAGAGDEGILGGGDVTMGLFPDPNEPQPGSIEYIIKQLNGMQN